MKRAEITDRYLCPLSCKNW